MPLATPACPFPFSQLVSPHHTISHGLTSSPNKNSKVFQDVWASCFLLFFHWLQWTLNQTSGVLVGAGRMVQSMTHSSKEALGVFSEWPSSNKGEVPGNVQEVINWSCPIRYLWGLQKVASGYFALKGHQEWRGMLSSHLLISFQNSIQKMWHLHKEKNPIYFLSSWERCCQVKLDVRFMLWLSHQMSLSNKDMLKN